MQVRPSLTLLLDEQRLAAVEGPVREQFAARPARAHRRRAGLEGAQVGEAHLLFDRIVEGVELPFPVGPATAEARRRSRTRSRSSGSRRPPSRSTRISSARRSPSTSGAPTAAAPRRSGPIDLRGRRLAAHARLGALHARADADHVAADARHGEGGAADRRPLARERPPLHAPLQLPALLGRGDRLHARAQAPRHRPRRARPAGARGDDPDGTRTSRTRSASSPRRWSRTARRRWAPFAARRCR